MPQSEISPCSVAEPLHLALFQPDIPQNTGTILRMAACFGVTVSIIEPAGFPVSDRAFRRAGMDYLDQVAILRHIGWEEFEIWRKAQGRRLILATTRGAMPHTDCRFRPSDIILLGRESAGVPDEVHAAADVLVRIPMKQGLRSLNLAVSAAILIAETLRQTNGFPKVGP